MCVSINCTLLFILISVSDTSLFAQQLGKEIITVKEGTWRSATVFTHVIWKDLLFYGAGSGQGGGDPRHEMEIGVFHLISLDSGYHHKDNPVITRTQFGLDQAGKGITPLSIFDRGDSLFMFCTSRPDDDLQPHIVLISASVEHPFEWGNYKTIVNEEFSGKKNNHGASAMIDPENPERLLLYFAARSPEDAYRILLATVPISNIGDSKSYRLLNGYKSAVLMREGVKANYPFVRYYKQQQEYELWYSGQSIGNTKTRSCFMTRSKSKNYFEPASAEVVRASGIASRNDNAYATGPKVYDNNLYYSGRKDARGNYLSIFYFPLKKEVKK